MQRDHFTDEHDMFREAFRTFLDREMVPHREAWTEAEIVDFTRAVGAVAKMIGAQPGEGGAGFRLISNAGDHAIQEVPHMHVHVLAGRPLGRILEPV